MGTARPDGGGSNRATRRRARNRLLAEHAGERRLLGRAALHRHRFSARVVPSLSRLFEALPALGARTLSQPRECQCPLGVVRDVIATAAEIDRSRLVSGTMSSSAAIPPLPSE